MHTHTCMQPAADAFATSASGACVCAAYTRSSSAGCSGSSNQHCSSSRSSDCNSRGYGGSSGIGTLPVRVHCDDGHGAGQCGSFGRRSTPGSMQPRGTPGILPWARPADCVRHVRPRGRGRVGGGYRSVSRSDCVILWARPADCVSHVRKWGGKGFRGVSRSGYTWCMPGITFECDVAGCVSTSRMFLWMEGIVDV